MKQRDDIGLYSCRKSQCYIPTLLEKEFLHFWPLGFDPEFVRTVDNHPYRKWNLHVNWTKVRNSKLNGILLCQKHHNWMLKLMEREMAQDVAEQEATDRWAVMNRGRI